MFFIIIVLTLLTSGTCRISHEIGALEVIIDKDRIYMQHLANVAEDNFYPAKERNKFASWYKKWTQAHIPLMVCLFLFFFVSGIHSMLHEKKHKKDCNWTRMQNHLVLKWILAKWLSVRLRIKWFWVQVQLQSLHLQIWCLLQARSSLTFRQL